MYIVIPDSIYLMGKFVKSLLNFLSLIRNLPPVNADKLTITISTFHVFSQGHLRVNYLWYQSSPLLVNCSCLRLAANNTGSHLFVL